MRFITYFRYLASVALCLSFVINIVAIGIVVVVFIVVFVVVVVIFFFF